MSRHEQPTREVYDRRTGARYVINAGDQYDQDRYSTAKPTRKKRAPKKASVEGEAPKEGE